MRIQLKMHRFMIVKNLYLVMGSKAVPCLSEFGSLWDFTEITNDHQDGCVIG